MRVLEGEPTHRVVIITPAFHEIGIAVVHGLPVKSILPGVTYASEFAWRKPQLKVVPARFPVAPQRAPRGSRARRSTQFRYMLSDPATVRLTIHRALPGRMRGARCVTPRRSHSRARRCLHQVPAGILGGTARTGQNAVPFAGRIGRKRLAPGSYRVTLAASDVDDGHAGPETTARFRVLPR